MSESPPLKFPDSDPQTRFMTLLNAHHRKLLGYIVALVGNRHDAEDVLQRASITMWRKFEQFEIGTDFMAWASTVAYYEAKRFIRLASRSVLQFDDALLELLARERSTDLTLQDARLQALDHCLGKLDEPSRELLRSAYLDESRIAELAATLERSPQTLYNKLNLIRRALSGCVERWLGEGGAA